MKRKLLISLLGSMLICSCSKVGDDGSRSQHQGVKDAYLSLSIELPSASKTKGGVKPAPGESGDGHEVGENSENEVKSLLVFGFPQDGAGTAFKKTILFADLIDLDRDENDVHSYKTKAPFQVSVGKYHLYVMVNPTKKMKNFSETQSEEVFKKSIVEFDGNDVSYKTDNFDGFPMSSADLISVTEITSANTKSKPAFFSTAVQRLFAKVVFTSSGEDLSATKASFAKEFKFVRYGVVNQRKSAYWFRRAGTTNSDAVIGAKNNNTNYIIDPIFDQKTSTYSDGFASQNYWNREEPSTNASYWKLVQNSGKNVEYCFENTMEKDAQLQGYTTGLVLEASFIPKEDNTIGGPIISGKTFFKYNDKYYADKTNLEAVLPAVKKLNNVDDENDETQRNKLIGEYGNFGVKVFYKGLCYYHYWIRHANNGTPTMGIMEFATVRNNVYKMTVNSVKQPGEPTPPVTPEHPDEETDVYLDVKVDVLPWIVRENSMDL